MSQNSWRFSRHVAAVLGGLALAAVLMTSSVLAVTGVTGPNDNPAMAQSLDMQQHALGPGLAEWFRIDVNKHNGETVVVTLPGAARNHLQFQIYEGGQLNEWTKQDPTGVGNVTDSGDLNWVNQFDQNRTWYVRVINNNTQCATFQFVVTGANLITVNNNGTQNNGAQSNTTGNNGQTTTQGNTNSQTSGQTTTQGNTTAQSNTQNNATDGCTAGAINPDNTQNNGGQNGSQGNTNNSTTGTNTGTPGNTNSNTTSGTTGNTTGNTTSNTTGGTTNGSTNGTPSGSVTGGINNEPSSAMLLDTNPHTLVGGQSQWYCFTLPGTNGQFAQLSLPGMAKSGLQFEIYPAAQVSNWRDQDPIGRGNVDENNNLNWAVQSDVRSNYYIRVFNSNPAVTMNNNSNAGTNNGANSPTNNSASGASNSASNNTNSTSSNTNTSACNASGNSTMISTNNNNSMNGNNNSTTGGANANTGNNANTTNTTTAGNNNANTSGNSNNNSTNTNNGVSNGITYQFMLTGPFMAP